MIPKKSAFILPRSLARKSSLGRIGFAATMPCPTTPCVSKPTLQMIGCYDHGGAVSCVLQTRIGLKCIPFRDEFSRGRLILMRFRLNWMRNWKTGRKTGYSSTSDFWQYSVYFTYEPSFPCPKNLIPCCLIWPCHSFPMVN